MSKASPDDLVVAFTSIERRIAEAVGDSDPTAIADLTAELDRHLAVAAAALGTDASPLAIARAIRGYHADQWDDATLDTLRQAALDAGAVLRRIGQRAGDSD